MKNFALFLAILLALTPTASAADQMQLGDGRIDGTRIKPYRHSWSQCALQDGQWRDQGAVEEQLDSIGNLVLRHRQTARRKDGIVSRSDTYFDRRTFAPLRTEMEATRDGIRVAYVERQLHEEGYSGIAIQGENRKVLGGAASSGMLHGAALGLPLAAMDYQEQPLEFLASMLGYDATYEVTARWVGKDTLEFGDHEVEAWMIDVEWHHRETGDVYPPGPDASGGRYWVVPHPPAGFPYVPRYKTDTYAVEFLRDTCPESAD